VDKENRETVTSFLMSVFIGEPLITSKALCMLCNTQALPNAFSWGTSSNITRDGGITVMPTDWQRFVLPLSFIGTNAHHNLNELGSAEPLYCGCARKRAEVMWLWNRRGTIMLDKCLLAAMISRTYIFGGSKSSFKPWMLFVSALKALHKYAMKSEAEIDC
jgi:hypothetical protein